MGRPETRPDSIPEAAVDYVRCSSPAWLTVEHQIAVVAELSAPVLVSGTTGSGKTLIARLIHARSLRAQRPLVTFDSIGPPERVIDDLFGSSAHGTAGNVGAAHGGTLVLENVTELPPDAQQRLLILLSTNQYVRSGSTTDARTANLRLIALSTSDLREAVAAGRLVAPLAERLLRHEIRVPTIAERREDIRALAVGICADACRRHKLPRLAISEAALAAAEARDWVWVGELAMTVERAVILATAEACVQIEARHLLPLRSDSYPSLPHPPSADCGDAT
jgi:DNA-binding NtrC family response regulator